MKKTREIVDFLIQHNFILGISAFSYGMLTYQEFQLTPNYYLLFFLFFATVFSYTILKKTKHLSDFFRSNFTAFCLWFCIGTLTFLTTKISTFERQVFFIGFLFTMLYGYSFLGIKKLREIPIIKIVTVAFIWTLTTCFIIIHKQIPSKEMCWILVSKLLFFLAIMILFEIVDLKFDSKKLQTVPQLVGVKNAKRIAFILFATQFLIMYFLNFSIQNVFLSTVSCLFLYKINENSTTYFTRLWLESVPFFLLLLCAIL